MNRDKLTSKTKTGFHYSAFLCAESKTDIRFSMTFHYPASRRGSSFSTTFHLQFFRRNHKRKRSENKYKFMNTENTNCAICRHKDIIVYSSKIEQYTMWITWFFKPITTSSSSHILGQKATELPLGISFTGYGFFEALKILKFSARQPRNPLKRISLRVSKRYAKREF